MPQSLEVQAPAEVPALRQQGTELVTRAQAVKITDPASYESAAGELRRVVNLRKAITLAFEGTDAHPGPKKLAHRTWRAISDLFNELLAQPERAESIIKQEVGRWEIEERRRREQEQNRIAADLKKGEEDERLRKAEALSEAGHKEEAEHLLEQPIVGTVVEIPHERPAGISTRSKWTFQILDESKIDRRFLTPDLKKIRQTVTAMGPDAVEVVGGIEVLQDSIVAVR